MVEAVLRRMAGTRTALVVVNAEAEVGVVAGVLGTFASSLETLGGQLVEILAVITCYLARVSADLMHFPEAKVSALPLAGVGTERVHGATEGTLVVISSGGSIWCRPHGVGGVTLEEVGEVWYLVQGVPAHVPQCRSRHLVQIIHLLI